MEFLKGADFKLKIKDNVLQDITGSQSISSNNPLLIEAEKKAKLTIYSYIKDRYDLEWLFGQKDLNRDFLLLDMMTTLVVYYLLLRTTTDIIPDIRMTEYTMIIQQLKDIRDGKINPDGWPLKNINYDYRLQNIYNNNISSVNDFDY